jgi:hypothetical protein
LAAASHSAIEALVLAGFLDAFAEGVVGEVHDIHVPDVSGLVGCVAAAVAPTAGAADGDDLLG